MQAKLAAPECRWDLVVVDEAHKDGVRVQVTLEIEATVPEGVPENVVRTVTENARALKFRSHGFEAE